MKVLRRAAAACALLCALQARAEAPAFAAVQAMHPPSESRLLDRKGQLLHESRTDPTRRRGQWVALSEISPRLRETVIRLEDRRFMSHAGVDWLALAAAARDTLRGHPRGASTITMQVAAQIDSSLRARGRRSWRQKWRQTVAAREIERRWTKTQILEAYLNLASFRGELQGIDSAARALFAKAPAALDAEESLLLAVALRSPNAAPARLVRRACALASKPQSCARLSALADSQLHSAPSLPPAATLAPQVARQLLERGVATTHSTLDAGLQQFAIDSLARQLRQLAPSNVHDGAVLAVDNATGEVLVYVGNGGDLSSARHVDGVRALRQAGSTLKPLLYELAIEQHLLTAASLLEDSPVNLQTPTGLYVPQNYDRQFRGMVSLRASLAGSLNVPAVRTLMLVGPDAFVAHLHAVGFDDIDRDGDYYGYALALGSPEVSLWQLVNAYRTLANGGRPGALHLRPQAETTTATVTGPRAAAAFVVGDVLADRASRSASFGSDNALNLPFWAAVKTGTSKQMRDNWCIGYTGRYTVGVWIGNFDGAPMWDVSGLWGAGPVWAELMSRLQQLDPAPPPVPPTTVERVHVSFADTPEPARDEWFLHGTATSRIELHATANLAPRIAYPGADSILVIDPDIPLSLQRVFFTMRPRREGHAWILNGDALETERWQPRPGRYTLELRDEAGKRIDTVSFAVRGSPSVALAAGESGRVGRGDEPR